MNKNLSYLAMTSNHFPKWIKHKSSVVEFSTVGFSNTTDEVNVEFLGQCRHVLGSWAVDWLAGLLESTFVRLVEVIEAFLNGNHSWMVFGHGLFDHFRQMLQSLWETCFGVELNQSDSKF